MEKLQFNYEMGGSGNYLVVTIQEEVNTYQLKMIENNKIPGVLPIHSMVLDGVHKLQYDITGKTRLVDYLNKERCMGESAKRLFFSLTTALVHSEDFLLSYNQFLLSKEFIYLNSTNEVSFVYLPLGKKMITSSDNIQEFIKGLLIDYFTADGDQFFLNLLRYVSMSEFSLLGFEERLKAGVSPDIVNRGENSQGKPVIIQEPLFLRESQEQGNKLYEDKLVYKQDKEVKNVQSEAKKGEKKSRNNDSNMSPVFDFAVPGMPAINASVKKEEVIKEKKKGKQKDKKLSFFDSLIGGKGKSTKEKSDSIPGKEIDLVQPQVRNAKKDDVWVGTQIKQDESEERTIILGEEQAVTKACLTYNGRKLCMNHFPFYIGREEADCVISHGRISRRHAFITSKEDKYYIVDENSTNHTFVKGNAIAPYTETEIVSGDVIQLADTKIVFTIEK